MSGGRAGPDRHRAREAALQLLYQWEVGWSGTEATAAADWFWTDHPTPATRRTFATALVAGTTEHLDTIDPLIEAQAEHWRLSRMAVVDRMIMRMAVFELVYTDTPPAVVIDEALELARTFSGDEAVPFVNGILDGVRRHLDARGKQPTVGD